LVAGLRRDEHTIDERGIIKNKRRSERDADKSGCWQLLARHLGVVGVVAVLSTSSHGSVVLQTDPAKILYARADMYLDEFWVVDCDQRFIRML